MHRALQELKPELGSRHRWMQRREMTLMQMSFAAVVGPSDVWHWNSLGELSARHLQLPAQPARMLVDWEHEEHHAASGHYACHQVDAEV